MKLDFAAFGNAGPGAPAPLPRKLIERRMAQLDIEPLDSSRRTIRVGLIALGCFLAIFLLFAFLAPISAAAIAPGTVSVSGEKFSIQSAASGIVSEYLVSEGQSVRAGQPLVRLNGIRSGAQLKQVQARRDALQALEARLTAERDGLAALPFPADLTGRGSDPAVARLMNAQRLIFDRHTAILGADRATTDQDLIAARAKQVAVERQLALLRDQLGDYRMLYRRGFARKTTIVSMEQSEAQLVAEAATGRAAIAQSQISQHKVRDSQTLDAASQLDQVQEQLAQLGPQLDVTRYLADQDVIRAPVSGRVSGVNRMGTGAVIGGGRPLMEIVPTGKPLIVEARVKPTDIDDVRVGQKAVIRFSSVNPHGRTAFDGHVVTLSPAPIADGGTSYYKAEVTLNDPERARREGLTLQPGIPASVNIKTRDRTLFQYLFGPFTDAVSHAFREE